MKSIWKYLAAAALLAALMCCCFGASAETSGDYYNIHWVQDDNGVLTISGTGAMQYIDDFAPWGNSAKKAVIEPGITSITDYAFWRCESLISIFIPESVTSIDELAIVYCNNLKTLM